MIVYFSLVRISPTKYIFLSNDCVVCPQFIVSSSKKIYHKTTISLICLFINVGHPQLRNDLLV